MIVSTGIDIVEVYRIAEAIARTPRFRDRVFTAAEIAYCESKGRAADQSFAGRFAAKEALLKALKTGWSGGIAWSNIEISNDENGAPSVSLSGEVKRIIDGLGDVAIHLSISHTREHATASVILERNDKPE